MVLKDFTGFKSILDEVAQIDHGKDGEKMTHIVEQMQQMVSLLQDLPYLTNEEERKVLMKRIETCREESQKALQELLAQYGVNFDEVKKFFSNPKNFKKTEWEDIQSMQHKIEAAANE